MATDDKAERDTPRSTWSGMWAVATVIGIGLSIISASKLAFMWLTIGPAPVVANVFEFYSTVVHMIFDPLLPLLQWLDWSWVTWFVSIPYWRDILALYLLFGAINARAMPWLYMLGYMARRVTSTTISLYDRVEAVIALPLFVVLAAFWPVTLTGGVVGVLASAFSRDEGWQAWLLYARGFIRNASFIIGGVILVIIGNAGLTAN